MGLSFLAPAFLAGVIAIAIPIVLHLFRRRTDRVVDFPAMQMLPEAPVESHERRRLRDLLLLALRAAALVLLALSFARPYFASGSAPVAAPTTIVAVDRSLSLGAPGQWAEAVRLASAALDAAPATHLVGVVAFDDRADLVRRPDRRPRRGPRGGGRAHARRRRDALSRGARARHRGARTRRRPHRDGDRPAGRRLGRLATRRRRPSRSRSCCRRWRHRPATWR